METQSSQIDIMGSQSQSEVRPTLRPTKHIYDQVILFHWNSTNNEPFRIYEKDHFSPLEIRDVWLIYQMKPDSRWRPLKKVAKLPGEKVSLFAKVEKGMFFFKLLIAI